MITYGFPKAVIPIAPIDRRMQANLKAGTFQGSTSEQVTANSVTKVYVLRTPTPIRTVQMRYNEISGAPSSCRGLIFYLSLNSTQRRRIRCLTKHSRGTRILGCRASCLNIRRSFADKRLYFFELFSWIQGSTGTGAVDNNDLDFLFFTHCMNRRCHLRDRRCSSRYRDHQRNYSAIPLTRCLRWFDADAVPLKLLKQGGCDLIHHCRILTCHLDRHNAHNTIPFVRLSITFRSSLTSLVCFRPKQKTTSCRI